ncbi:MAG: hypothetical protein KC493_11325 [Bacteriovoracaceae bacterium]|nr:hypothetical protein [Bacteriovoracaceae bacterium]
MSGNDDEVNINLPVPSSREISKEQDATESFLSYKTEISGNRIEGVEVDEGDVFIGVKNELTFVKPDVNPKAILALVERYKDLPEDDIDFLEMKNELEDYRQPRPNREIIGVEAKLKAGNRAELINIAKEYKSDANERLAKYEFSSHASAIHLTIMTKIEEKFNSYIVPIIQAGVSNEIIDKAISTIVIEPLYDEVRVADITLSPKRIRGMMFLMTGNCHIKWSKD